MRNMKTLWAALTAAALVFASCKMPLNNDDDSGETSAKLPSLTIKNESSYVLTDVKFSGVSFAAPNSADLPSTTQAVKQLAKDDLNKAGYITFVRKDIGITCRTEEVITISGEDYTFTFTDQTVVVEQANTGNKKSIAQITFISKLEIEYGGLQVDRNDTVNMGEAITGSAPKQAEFLLKNTGVGKLLLSGNEPVKISGADVSGVLSVVQPSNSDIAPGASLSFKVAFNPATARTYTGTVTVSTNDPSGDFSFTVNAAGAAPKPIIGVWNGTTEIAQNGTMDMGDVIIGRPGSLDLFIKNSGDEVLNIQNTQITITGENPDMFSIASSPSANISPGAQSLFSIRFTPTGSGEKRATITIPSNDTSRPHVVFFVQANGKREFPVLEIKHNDTLVSPNGGIDIGNVDVGTAKTLTFTLNNRGPVNLNLTGTPALVDISGSSNFFTIAAQPSKNTIEPNDSASFTLRFSPAEEGAFEAAIGITCSTEAGYFSFTVTGTGHIKRPQIQVQSEGAAVNSGNGRVDFGEITPDSNKTLNLTIKNTGDAVLNLTGSPVVAITGVDASSFTITQQPNVSLAPGAETVFTVRFAPSTEKIYEAQVGIVSDSRTNGSFTFTLSGKASVAASFIWNGAWIKDSDNKYTSNFIDPRNETWETLSITAFRECSITVRITISSEGDCYGCASELDGYRSYAYSRISVSGNDTKVTTYTVPAGTHYIYFGYESDYWYKYYNDKVTVEIVSVE